MQRKPADIEPHDPQDAHVARVAWWGAFVLTVVLILGLSVVRSAQAATPPAVPTLAVPGIVENDDEEEDESGEEVEVEECELAEEEAEEGEEPEAECEEGVAFGPPPACFLSSADAAVTTDLVHDRLRLAVRYTAAKPATVAVDYWLRGSRGPLNLEGDQKHFGRNGVFRLTQDLTDAQAKRVAAARSFTITIDPVNAPRSCSEFLDQHLSVRKAIGGGEMFTDTESTFRHARRARHH